MILKFLKDDTEISPRQVAQIRTQLMVDKPRNKIVLRTRASVLLLNFVMNADRSFLLNGLDFVVFVETVGYSHTFILSFETLSSIL